MTLPRLRGSLSVFLIAVAWLGTAHAQGTGRSMDIDPSIRSSGMGGASNAVFWDQVTDHWANPALLGYQHGLSYEWSNTQLVPGLAADVHFSTNVLKLGASGLGLAFSGKPFGLGGVHLDYGESEGTDQHGNPTGTFNGFEQVDSWSFGISAARVAETVAQRSGGEPKDWSRYGDVSFGMTGKHWEFDGGPSFGTAETDAHDLGYLVRFSPTEFVPNLRDVVGLDFAYGWSDLSYDGELVAFPSSSPVDISEHERRGYAGRVRIDWPPTTRGRAGPSRL